jgi:hypothetical protein
MIMAQICPNCGFCLADPRPPGKLRRLASAYGSYRQHRLTTFQSTALTPWQPTVPDHQGEGRYLEAERRTPYRPQNAESDFLVPLLQAIGTGAFITVVAGWAAWLYRGFTWDMAVGSGLIAAGGFWVITVTANRKLLWVVETMVNSDLDQDGAVGQPTPPAREVTLNVMHQNHKGVINQVFRFDLPAGISEEDFQEFAQGIVRERRGLAESAWAGTGRPFSKPKYNELLDALTAAGIVRWINPDAHAQGRELTEAGQRSLRRYLYVARTHTHADNGASDYAFIEEAG